ncbi:MAG TPA: hypothetical protein VKB01_09825 [Thermomicrobiales bacterium]|nr:hypothetical protein [Thermomicrobiales bacterium]
MDPCPCGYYGDPRRACTCPSGAIVRYQEGETRPSHGQQPRQGARHRPTQRRPQHTGRPRCFPRECRGAGAARLSIDRGDRLVLGSSPRNQALTLRECLRC